MRTHVIQTSFLSGVLSPEAASRVDTDAYNQGLLEGVNIVPRPLGGVRRRPGLRYVDRLPNVLSRLTSGISITTPNGGTGANANDGSTATLLTTTTNVSTVDPYVVVQYDLGSAQTVVFADVLEIASTGGSSLQFVIQYSADGVAWGNVGDAFELVDVTARSYRRRCPLTAYRYWRVVKTGGTDMGAVTISLQEFNLWAETSTISAVRLIPFEVDTDTQYIVAFTDRSMTIYEDGVLVVRLPSPYASAELAALDAAQSQDSLVIVHEDHVPRFVFPELGTIYSSPIAFDRIPQYDFDDTSSPTPVSEVQVVTFASGWKQGETFQLDLEGARSGAITYAGDATADEQSATADNIAREVQKLYTVPGFTGVSCARTSTRQYTVTFANASAKDYELMSGVPLTGVNDITVTRSAGGTARTEDAWSATRGYPRTVTFFEGRLFFGGTRSLPVAIIGSKVNQILDLEIEEAFDDDACFVLLNGQQLNAVQGLYASRVLQVFTSGGEMRYAKEQGAPVTPRDVPVMQTQYGAAKIRPVATDGTTIFIQRTRKAVRDFRYDYEEDAYNSLGISALAPHLIDNVVGLTAWNGSSTDEINLVFVINADGTAAVLTSRREAQVRAWVQWTTSGYFKAAAGVLEETYFAVQRTIDTTDTLFLEVTDPTYYLDCAIQSSPGSATVTGLSHLDGATCRVRADGYVLENVVPSGGSATLVEGAFTDVEVGLGFNPAITPMPLNQMLPSGDNFMRKRRVTKVRVKLYETLGLLVNGRVIPDTKTDIDNLDAAATPFSGIRSIEESTNWDEDEDKLITFSQVDPLPMTILGVDITMEGND